MNENLPEIHFDAGERVVPPAGLCHLARSWSWGVHAPSMGGAYADEQTFEQFSRTHLSLEEIFHGRSPHI